MFNEILETRWSADHLKKIEVRLAENAEGLDWVHEDFRQAGCAFFTTDPVLRSEFHLPELPRNDEARRVYRRQMKKALLDAIRAGDHVFYMVHGEHSCDAFWFQDTDAPRPRFSDSWLAGFVIVNREAWKQVFTGRPASRKVVGRWLDQMAEYIEHEINGWVYEYRFADLAEDEDYWSNGFLSEEEALAAAIEEHPECAYTDDAFEEATTYRLIPPAGRQIVNQIPANNSRLL